MITCQIPSFTDTDKVYTVNLTLNSCSCPDFCKRRATGCGHELAGTDCKHMTQARQEQAERLALIAGTLLDEQLQPLIEKHTAAKNWPVVLALLAEAFDREQLARMPAPPPVFHSLDAVLVRARAWGREQKDTRLRNIFA